uniref:FMP27/BLTP2/Hobbit GFWDK motif-containing RBG unit domain-containing protein n=1 Tax=Parascaris univalens TaxID=6257 RepID=A0A915BX08_PARUN
MGIVILLVVLITVVLLTWRYLGWVVSRILARYCGCESVRLGRCGFFYIQHIKLCLHSGITVEVDELRLSSSFFNAHFTKPLMVTAGDVRIEGERKTSLSGNSPTKQPRKIMLSTDVERLLHWLQYAGAVVRTARIVFIDAVPGCLLHSTFQAVQLDAFRDREGMQLELSCRLAQAKLFSRGRAQHTTPLLELSLTSSLCADVTISEVRLRRVIVSITNPLLSLSDGLLDYLREHPILPKTESSFASESTSEAEPHLLKARLLSNVKLDIDNLTFRYIAVMDGEMNIRTVGASLGCVEASVEGGDRISVALSAIHLCDQSSRSHFKCSDFVVTLIKEYRNDASRYVSFDARVFNPWLLICQNDLTSWIDYITQLERRISNKNTFDDDFASDYTQAADSREWSAGKIRERWCISISAEVNALRSRLMTLDSRDIDVGVDLITFNANNNFANVEVGVEYLWVRRGASFESASPFSFERHVWGTALVMGAALAQFSRSPKQKLLQMQLDECHFEYEDELAQQIASFVCAVLPSEAPSANRMDSWSDIVTPSPRQSAEFVVQISAKKLAVFLTARQASFVVMAVEQTRIDAVPKTSTLSVLVENLKIGQGPIIGIQTTCWDSMGNMTTQHMCGEGGRLIARSSTAPNSLNLVLLADAPVTLVWDPVVHIVFLETYRSAKKIHGDVLVKRGAKSAVSRSLVFTIDTSYPVALQFRLPREHIMCWEVPSLLIQRDDNISLRMSHFVANMDSHPILTLEKFSVQRRAIDARMDLGRAEFKNLFNRTNKVWAWSADSLAFLFPYGYNFAAAFDEVINAWKWIKLVHDLKPKPFTVDSPLPSDLSFSIKNASLQMNDDPFEVQLQTNYELMVDEVYECERRRQMLDQKLEQLRKAHPLLPQWKVDELHRSLLRKNAEIYVERSMKTSPSRTHLLISSISNLEIHAYADRSLHGKDNAVRVLRLFNPEAPYPAEGMEFSTLWARAVELDFNEWSVQFRDYPLPYMLMKDGHFWGHLVGAEHLAGNRSIRNCRVILPQPWGEYIVDRNMCPLKYYYDIECEIASLNCTYGPCWEPCLSMISLCWNNVSAPSRDPSALLPFWDKIRLLFHGRLSMLCKHLVTSMLASTDPYNSTELVEISWKDFEFDWTTGQLCMQTDVDAFVRTASKYDDSRVLHLPGFKFSVIMNWACIGDPHDHHSAQPCAPDKLPDYASTNHEHDSYRPFRSTHLDLILNLEVKPQSELSSDSQYPQILLYANTFRWLEFLKNTMTTVNRPVKRGSLFGQNQSRKSQLSRHYKHIRLNVALPRFLISYWMSFSSSHGFRMISESLHLTSSMELHITRSEEPKDGVNRRRSSKWAVSHVSAQLANVQMHLFGDSTRPMSDKFITKNNDDSFFIGLDRLSYIRESMLQSEGGNRVSMLDGNDGGVAVHRLTIHDLRASWTPENRDTCLAIADGIHKAHILRKILSNDALKACSFTAASTPPATVGRSVSTSGNKINSTRPTAESEKSPGRSRFGSEGKMIEENDMLQKLIDEAETKLVAYSEEATDVPSDLLHGIALCNGEDVFLTNWQIDLINSQAVLRGRERDGFVLLTAARASVTQRFHLPVWNKSQLLGKRSWCAILSGMQYFAPLVMAQHQGQQNGSPSTTHKEQFRWLPRDVIEEKTCSDPNISDKLDNYISTGEAVGGVVAEQGSTEQSADKLQLQRVVSRCSCQVYFCYFSDTLDIDTHNMPLPMNDVDQDAEVWGQREPVDCFTLKHNMLEVGTVGKYD